MNIKERQKIIKELKKICVEIGCAGCSKMCDDSPQGCDIIRKLIISKPNKTDILL